MIPYRQLLVDAPTAETIHTDPADAILYLLFTLLIFGASAGIINVIGYYNSVAKDETQRWKLRRALPIFALAFIGSIVDFLVSISLGGANATPIILALVVAGDRVESLVRNIHRDHTDNPSLPVQQQVVDAIAMVVNERDGIEDAFRKVHDAYEEEIGPIGGSSDQNSRRGSLDRGSSKATASDPSEVENITTSQPIDDPDTHDNPPNVSGYEPESEPDSPSQFETIVDYSDNDLRLLGGMDSLDEQKKSDHDETRNQEQNPSNTDR